MNLNERIMAVFRGETPDVIPWFADLTYWYESLIKTGRLPEKYKGNSRFGVGVELYKELGCGAHEELYNLPAKLIFKNTKIRVNRYKDDQGNIITERKYITPIGTISSKVKYMYTSYSSAFIKYCVNSVEDLKVLKYMYENLEVKENRKNIELQYEWMKEWREYGVVSSIPPRTPFSRMLVEWAGVMNTLRLYWRAREELEDLLQIMAERDDMIYEIISEAPAPLVYFGENLTSEVISPRIFRQYYEEYYNKRAREMHRHGKYIYVHIDGTLRSALPCVGKTEVDCAQALTPAPAGDIPIERFRELAGPKIILWGGLPGVFFSKKYPEKLLMNMLEKIFKYHLSSRKFIVGVADQVPPDGDIIRVKHISKRIEKEGRYL